MNISEILKLAEKNGWKGEKLYEIESFLSSKSNFDVHAYITDSLITLRWRDPFSESISFQRPVSTKLSNSSESVCRPPSKIMHLDLCDCINGIWKKGHEHSCHLRKQNFQKPTNQIEKMLSIFHEKKTNKQIKEEAKIEKAKAKREKEEKIQEIRSKQLGLFPSK